MGESKFSIIGAKDCNITQVDTISKRIFVGYNNENETIISNKNRILIITALILELDAVINTLKSPLEIIRSLRVNNREYYVFEYKNTEVYCTAMFGMGQLNAAAAIYSAVTTISFDAIFLTGICGAINSNLNFGDIVVSDQIVDYEIGKKSDHDDEIRWNVYRSDPFLVDQIKHFQSTIWCEYLQKKFPSKHTSPKVHIGTILSGNKIIASKDESRRLTLAWKKALAVEMESAGVASALFQLNKTRPAFVTIKAVSDFADSSKNDDWQEFSSYASAAFTISFIMSNFTFDKSYVPPSEPKYKKLRYIIQESFNLNELHVLAFDIGVDFEDIPGDNKSGKVVGLIEYCIRHGLINNLINEIKVIRKNTGL